MPDDDEKETVPSDRYDKVKANKWKKLESLGRLPDKAAEMHALAPFEVLFAFLHNLLLCSMLAKLC